jgi:hypothetical protein
MGGWLWAEVDATHLAAEVVGDDIQVIHTHWRKSVRTAGGSPRSRTSVSDHALDGKTAADQVI